MPVVADVLVGLIAVLHVWFLVLEMFLFRTPLGLKTFGTTKDDAEVMATLAANQGLYNGFLAAGLVVGLVAAYPVNYAFKIFFLSCVVLAGLYGGVTVSRRILFVQAVPAAAALALVLISG